MTTDNTTPMGELPAVATGGTLTIAEACALFGVSDSTIRRAIKKGRLVAEHRKTDKGTEYVFTAAALEAAGYRKPAPNAVQVVETSANALALEEARRELAEAKAAAEVAAIRREYLERENARLVADLDEVKENLRKALDRIPVALPPAPPSLASRIFRRNKPPKTA
jgi:excisionase family DNA binding protein